MNRPRSEPPRSPCVGVCVLGSVTLDGEPLCTACLRSLDEITRWSREDASGQQAILDAVAARREAEDRRRAGD